jgi:hypothetical protein
MFEAFKTTDFLFGQEKKRKSITVGNSEIVDCFEHLEKIKVYKLSSHEEEKPLKMNIEMFSGL